MNIYLHFEDFKPENYKEEVHLNMRFLGYKEDWITDSEPLGIRHCYFNGKGIVKSVMFNCNESEFIITEEIPDKACII